MHALIINGIIALTLAACAICKKNALSTLFFLFIYISLHYSYSVLSIYSYSNFYFLRESTQIGAKLIGIIYIVFILSLVIARHKENIFVYLRYNPNKLYVIIILLWLSATIWHWVQSYDFTGVPPLLSIQNMMSTLSLVILSLFLGISISNTNLLREKTINQYSIVLISLLFVILIIAVYELLTKHTWGGAYRLETGEIVFRASSILFNSNLLGFWSAFLSICTAFIHDANLINKNKSYGILILCGLIIFLSGSRSSFLISIIIFVVANFIPIIMKKDRRPYFDTLRPLLIFFATFFSVMGSSKLLSVLFGENNRLVKTIGLLSDRFISMPVEIFSYGYIKFTNLFNIQQNVQITSWLKNSSLISITGRFTTDLVDNGFIVMYMDAGPAAVIIWIAYWIINLLIGIKVLLISPHTNSVYALSAIMGCIVSSFFVRSFQVFPFWLIIAMTLSFCYAWFNSVLVKNKYEQNIPEYVKENDPP